MKIDTRSVVTGSETIGSIADDAGNTYVEAGAALSVDSAAGASADVKKYVSFGAGPRAGQYMVLGAKARAAMDGRSVPDIDDVKAVAAVVLGHRLVMNFQAEAEGVGVERLLSL